MKCIKLFEDFDTVNNLVSNTKEIIRPLSNFSFNAIVKSAPGRITIEISKMSGEELRVFQFSDISGLIEESDKYLSLGEGLKLESIFLETIYGTKELDSINSLKRERVGLLSIYISYLL